MKKLIIVSLFILGIFLLIKAATAEPSDLEFIPYGELGVDYVIEGDYWDASVGAGGAFWINWFGLGLYGNIKTLADISKTIGVEGGLEPFMVQYGFEGKVMMGKPHNLFKTPWYIYLQYYHDCVHMVTTSGNVDAFYDGGEGNGAIVYGRRFYPESTGNMSTVGIGLQFGQRY